MKMNRSRVIIFQKNPIYQHVKTRLSADVGAVKALQVYEHLLAHLMTSLKGAGLDIVVYYDLFIDPLDGWGSSVDRRVQIDDKDLGRRMYDAVTYELQAYQKVMLIGSDCPEIDGKLLHQALDLLNQVDVVVGPAVDGGFYLLGMKRLHPDVFQHIKWSTKDVRAQLLSNLGQLNMTLWQLSELMDIDHLSDWEAYLRNYSDVVN